MMIDPQDILKEFSDNPDADVDVARVAIALSALDQPGISVERYLHHLDVLASETGDRYLEVLQQGVEDGADAQLQALRTVLCDEHGYRGDSDSYDDLQNASLIRVIERTKGLPIALSILYIHAARAQGWVIDALSFPGHVVCRIGAGGQRIIFDPFQDCKVLEAPDLRFLVKKAMGQHAELSSAYLEPSSNREILIRLQNNIKHRQIEVEDYAGALESVKRMRLVDPTEYRLLLDAGILYARVEQTRAAIDTLEDYLKRAPKDQANGGDRHDALLLLDELRGRLN